MDYYYTLKYGQVKAANILFFVSNHILYFLKSLSIFSTCSKWTQDVKYKTKKVIIILDSIL